MTNSKTSIILKEKKIKKKKYAFNDNIRQVVINEPTQIICESTFYGCRNLCYVFLPESLKIIEDDAFASCNSLSDINLPKSLEKIGERAFFWSGVKELSIPDGITEIPSLTFSNCRMLEKINISNNCKKIGEYAFLNCSVLKEIVLPDTVTALGKEAFRGCSELKTVILSDNITRLHSRTFDGCRSLETVVLPQKLEHIDDECFAGCVSLKKIVFPDGLKSIGEKSFSRCENLETVILPPSCNYIGTRSFSACKKLKTVKTGNSLGYVGAAVFTDSVCDTPTDIKAMYCTSFLPKSTYTAYPTVTVPKTVTQLNLGFKSLLSYTYTVKGKTCFPHILLLQKYSAKVFISENYYSYDDKSDKIISDGVFDFERYDSFFEKAEPAEMPLIAVFRLTYPEKLGDGARKAYEKELFENAKSAALFTLNTNEEKTFEYLIENIAFTPEYYEELHTLAQQKGYTNLMRILTLKRKKSGFNDIDSILKDLLL